MTQQIQASQSYSVKSHFDFSAVQSCQVYITDLALTQQIKPSHETFYIPKIGRREFSERREFSVRQEFSVRHKFRGRPKFMVRPKFCVRRTENEKLRVRPKFMVRRKFCGRRKVSGRREFSTNGKTKILW